MAPRTTVPDRLRHILDAIGRIEAYTAGQTFDDYDFKYRDMYYSHSQNICPSLSFPPVTANEASRISVGLLSNQFISSKVTSSGHLISLLRMVTKWLIESSISDQKLSTDAKFVENITKRNIL